MSAEFRKLSTVWSNDPNLGMELAKWEGAVRWLTDRYHDQFPLADWEPVIREAIYLAVFTHDPTKGSMLNWIVSCARYATGGDRNREKRRRAKLKRNHWVDREMEERFYYINEQ